MSGAGVSELLLPCGGGVKRYARLQRMEMVICSAPSATPSIKIGYRALVCMSLLVLLLSPYGHGDEQEEVWGPMTLHLKAFSWDGF